MDYTLKYSKSSQFTEYPNLNDPLTAVASSITFLKCYHLVELTVVRLIVLPAHFIMSVLFPENIRTSVKKKN
jgi:hypothetical protein